MLANLAQGIIKPNPSGGFINTDRITTITNALAADVWKVAGAVFLLGLILLVAGKFTRRALALAVGCMTGAVVLVFGVVAGPTLVEKVGTMMGGLFQ